MRKPCSALIIFVLLVFGLSLAVPAEDVAEAAYDESETQPYDAITLFSIVAQATTRCTTQAVLREVHPRSGIALPSAKRNNDAGSHRSAKALVALALRCSFLC